MSATTEAAAPAAPPPPAPAPPALDPPALDPPVLDPPALDPPAPAPPVLDPAAAQRWLAGLQTWIAARAELPDQPSTYIILVTALRQSGQAAFAETVLGEGARQFAGNVELAMDYARAAEQRRDWEAAQARWNAVRVSFPGVPAGHLRAGQLLRRELQRPDEAETVLAAAVARLPSRPEIWLEFAAVAADRKDRQAAIARLRVVCERFPAQMRAWRMLGQMLREEKRFDAADAALVDALIRFPDEQSLMMERATIAHERQDWAEAALRWQAVYTTHPDARLAYWMHAGIMINSLHDYEAAEELLDVCAIRFPDHAGMAADWARVADKRGDAAEAARRWADAAARFPNDAAIAAQAARSAAALASAGDGATAG